MSSSSSDFRPVPKLHEILTLERSVKTRHLRALATFERNTKRVQNLTGQIIEEAALRVPGDPASGIDDYQEVTNTTPTVPMLEDQLRETMAVSLEWLTYSLTKKETNANNVIVGELVIEGVSLGRFSGTTLLGIEHYYRKLRELVLAAPKLDHDERWHHDPKRNVYVSTSANEPISKLDESGQAVIVGYRRTLKMSTKMSKAAARQYVARIDAIIAATQKARNEANRHEVVWCGIAHQLHQYVLTGSLEESEQ